MLTLICSVSESLESFCSISTCLGRGEGGAGLFGRSGGFWGEACTRFGGLLAGKKVQTLNFSKRKLPKLSIVSSCSNFELNIVSQTRCVLSVNHGGGCDGFRSESDTKTFNNTVNLSW